MVSAPDFDGRRDADAINLLDVWNAVRADWKLLACIVAVFALAAVVIALTMTPVYRAESVVTPVDPGARDSAASALVGQLGNLAGIAGINLGDMSGSSNKGRVTIQSRSLIEEFIRRNKLIPILYADREAATSDGQPTLWLAVEDFEDMYSAEPDPETGLITVRVEWTDPKLAAEWANGLVALANELLRNRDHADAQRSLKYLNGQLAQTNVVGLQQVLYNLIEIEMRTLMLSNARQEYALAIIDRAVVPELRQRPKRKQIVILGTLLGGIVGLFFIAIRRALRSP
ncbi:MAG: Wzz/FepE/Etk N-terminal domain-containing protein [Steroidobacteraceae bacterium]